MKIHVSCTLIDGRFFPPSLQKIRDLKILRISSAILSQKSFFISLRNRLDASVVAFAFRVAGVNGVVNGATPLATP